MVFIIDRIVYINNTINDFFAVDDPLDAVAVHFGGGLWGLIGASIFDNNGFVFGDPSGSGMVSNIHG